MSLMRVGVITYDSYLYEPRVRRLSEAAADAGCQVDLICLGRPGEKRYEVRDGIHVYRLPMSRSASHSLPVTILLWCWFLLLAGVIVTWLHLRHAYDIINVHNIPDFLVFSTVFPKLLGAKILLDVQDVCPELMAAKAKGRLRGMVTRLATWQERLSTAFADHVLTSGWPFEELLLQRGVPRENLTVIIDSTDPRLFPASRRFLRSNEPPNESRPFILMYLGTLAERSGMAIALRALVLARRVVPHIRLDIKGFGDVSTLRNLAVELGVDDIVEFSSVCPVEEVVDFILHGDVGIIPYQCDGFTEMLLPTKAYEFAWMHRPMIASHTSGIRSMFRPESIVLCDPSSPQSFADAIIDLYQHPEKRACLVANAAQDYEAYRWEKMAELYEQLLISLNRKQIQKPDQVVHS